MALKFMQNYIYGKPNKPDFTQSDLPKNRFELFRDVLKTRWNSMVSLNFLYILIWIPAAVWTIINVAALFAEAGDGVVDISQYLLPYLLILFPLITITGPFNIGASFVCRNWARDEHAFVWADFRDAMKANWKQALLFSVIEGLLPLVLIFSIRFYTQMSAQSILFYLPACILMIVGVLWKLSAMVMPTLIVTYDLNFRNVVRNAFIMTMAALPKAVAIKLATLAVPLLVLLLGLVFPSTLLIAVSIAGCLYAVFMPAFNKLLIASYSNAVCEKYLNPKIAGARTNIGLRPDIK